MAGNRAICGSQNRNGFVELGDNSGFITTSDPFHFTKLFNLLLTRSFKMWLTFTVTLCSQITGVPQESLVTVVKPGLPTTADLYVLPLDSKPAKRSMFVDKVRAHTWKPHPVKTKLSSPVFFF